MVDNTPQTSKPDHNSDQIIGIFPGRFQPPTYAHVQRIEQIRALYPHLMLSIIIGDVGTLNNENFLTPDERVAIFSQLSTAYNWKNVRIHVVKGAPAEQWISALQQAVPRFSMVFSDNPFVTIPLSEAGYTVVSFEREGVDASQLRDRPFDEWRTYVPSIVYDYLETHGIYNRFIELHKSGKYPFLPNHQSDS